MAVRVFFYGTLMTGFHRRLKAGIDPHLRYVGRGAIQAALYDLGIYPAAVPGDGSVWGEVFETDDPDTVLSRLDSIEGYQPGELERSLYFRVEAPAALVDGERVTVWVYFYNAPLGQAARIASGDYLQHLAKAQA